MCSGAGATPAWTKEQIMDCSIDQLVMTPPCIPPKDQTKQTPALAKFHTCEGAFHKFMENDSKKDTKGPGG